MNPLELVQKIGSNWLPATWQDVNVGVALSGGADSVALLRSLHEIKQAHGGIGDLVTFHVNHHLRGAASDGEQLWCEELCRELRIPFEALHGDVAGRAQKEGDGIEAAARHERYALLSQVAEQRGIRYLAFAHTQNDQVETILFRLLRGTGLRGLAGMTRARPLTPTLSLIRPMLACTRAEVLAYLSEKGQSFCSDQSNADCQFVRNRLRNEMLPLLRSDYAANVDNALLRLSEQASEAQSYFESEAHQLLSRSSRETSLDEETGTNCLRLRHSSFQREPLVLVREALRIAWREAGLAEQEMNFDWWCKLASLTSSSASNKTILNLPGNVRAQINNDWLRIEWQRC